MATSTFSHNGERGYPTEQRESHWLPALRPDAHTNESILDTEATSISYHDQSTYLSSDTNSKTRSSMSGNGSPSDEDDEGLDPAWGIRRTDSAHILDRVHRTTSFPQFAPQNDLSSSARIPMNLQPITASQSQFETLLSGVDGQEVGNINEQIAANQEILMDHEEQLHSAEEVIAEQSEAVSDRFQEGLPLIDTEQQPQAVTTSHISSADTFNDERIEDDTTFFAQISSTSDPVHTMPTLDRKSTSDVLHALNIQGQGAESPVPSNSQAKEVGYNMIREQNIGDTRLRKDFSDENLETDVFSPEIDPENMRSASEEDIAGIGSGNDTFTNDTHESAYDKPAENATFDTVMNEAILNTSHLEDEFNAVIKGDAFEEDVSANVTAHEMREDAFAQEPSADELFAARAPADNEQPEALDAKWAAVLDDEEFLIEDADDLLPDSEPGSPSSFIASLQDTDGITQSSLGPQNDVAAPPTQQASRSRTTTNPYTPHQPSSSDMAQLSPKTHGNVGIGRPGLAPMGSFQSQLQRPVIAPRTESFVDQAKGGYKSPYDLPIDLAKPKKRQQTQRPVSQQQKGVPLPPPRTSSMSSEKQLQPPFTPTMQAFGPATGNSVVTSPPKAQAVNTSAAQKQGATRKSSSSGFFEELPIVSRPRPTSGRYTPSQNVMSPPTQLPPQSPPRHRIPSVQAQASPPRAIDPVAQYQLQPPEKLDPYANVALQSSQMPSINTSSRYSPAPPASLGAPRPTPSPRYSPVPSQAPGAANRYVSQPSAVAALPQASATSNRYASQPVPPPSSSNPALQFQPRTSSPLAYQRPVPPEQTAGIMPPPQLPRSTSFATDVGSLTSPPKQAFPARPIAPSNPFALSSSRALDTVSQPDILPPKRSQTQSPSRQMGPQPTMPMPSDSSSNRPASAHGLVSAQKVMPKQDVPSIPQSYIRSRAPVETLDFIRPNDETNSDPLERWKGAPIFQFGFGGTLTTSFPQHTPRYSSGTTRPQIKATAGEVTVRKTTDIIPLPEHVSGFPGPLRGKSKKKDVLNWLTTSIARLEAESPSFLGTAHTLPDPRKRHAEKILLWKIVRVLVEHDGALEANANAVKAVNAILAPEVHAIDEATASQYKSEDELSGIYRPAGANVRSDSIDPLAVETLRKHLLKGNREQAVWHAVDNRLWSHALLISSTLERTIWKQVVQEFVRQEVKTIGNNAESLATMYEIFGGNVEDSIDQLVPPSARAGLQMVSKVESLGPTKNALDGLDRWRETLTLILNNRNVGDQAAMIALAKLLGDYGRVEAAHLCLLFARSPAFPSLFGGLDEQQAGIVLLGADQRSVQVQLDEDALLLTEVYEFATNTLGSGSLSAPLPYLASYKLQRAKTLSDYGLKVEAQAYCEAITAGIGTKTKISPYYHPAFLAELDDLSNRLKQIPVQSSSWMTKPSIEKVSGSIFSKFTNFVAGDDSDAESKGSGKDAAAESGPFANVSGSPSLSRSGSQTDIYGSFPTMTPAVSATGASSRYAPNGMISARSSSEFTRGRPSLDSQRSPPATSYGQEARQNLYAPMVQHNASPARSTGSYQPLGTSPSRGSYQATPPQASYMPVAAQHQATTRNPDLQVESYIPTPPAEEAPPYMPVQTEESVQPAFGGYVPSSQQDLGTDQLPLEVQATSNFDSSQSYGYEPPADTGYVPYEPEPESDDESSKKTKPKKKSFMDDDNDDDFSRSANVTQPAQPASKSDDAAARRKAADEAADAAFRAAAEADAARAKEQAAAKKSGSWFGGWLGGKKADDDSLGSQKSSSGSGEQKVHQVKLGEKKMKLYYDKELKKWVNPDDPDSAKPKAGPAPPPRMGGTPGPPRSVSSPMPPMDASRSSTPASIAGAGESGIAATLPPGVNATLGLSNGATAATGVALPPSGAGTPPSAPVGGPPKKPAMSATSSIDDLLGPATGARKGAKTTKKKGGGRYVDVFPVGST